MRRRLKLNRRFAPLAVVCGAVFVATQLFALDAPHDQSPGPTGCDICHTSHAALGRHLINQDYIQDVCVVCHDGVIATEMETHIDVTDESSPWYERDYDGNGQDIVCTDCHDPHSQYSALGENFVGFSGEAGGNILRRTPTGNVEILYDSTQERASYVQRTADGPYGVCEACHSVTEAFDKGGTSDTHFSAPDEPCGTCHEHESGFEPSGGCVLCHNQAQNGRRQIVGVGGDFERVSHHIDAIPTDADCKVCHNTREHQAGTVRLNDPDQGDSQVYPFDSGDPTSLGDFCINCHDGDGATASGGLTPFSSGNTPADIAGGGLWAVSAHATGGETNSGYPSCFGDCHGNAHGSNLTPLLQPYDGAPGTDNVNEEEGFCFDCHGSSGAVINEMISNGRFDSTYEDFGADVEAAFGLASVHPVNDSAPGHFFDIGDGVDELECTSCHSVHRATARYWDAPSGQTPVSRYLSGELWGDEVSEAIASWDSAHLYEAPYLGESSLDLSGQDLPIGGDGSSLLSGTVLPDYNTLCLDCHASPLGMSIAIDWANQWHGSAPADPHLGTEAPAEDTGFGLASPYLTGNRGQYVLACVDCHEGHGSDNIHLVRRSVNGEVVDTVIDDESTLDWASLCNNCHLFPDPRHIRHMSDEVYAELGDPECGVCHAGHGGAYTSCVASGCHGHEDRF